MNCPRCESAARRANKRWGCTGCGYAFKSRPPATIEERQQKPPTSPQPRMASDADPSLAPPPPDRIRLGDVWLDLQGRRHIARPCVVDGLLLMEPLDHELVPVAMCAADPKPWRRVTWGGND